MTSFDPQSLSQEINATFSQTQDQEKQSPSKKNPYADFLHLLEKPARYIGGEHFTITKNWESVSAKVALCFPDAYEIGMSHLGFKILYDQLNQNEMIAAERCFAPWVDMEKEMRARNLDLVSLENFRPLRDFDILGFSLQYEMTYTNILQMIELGGVPIWQKDRKENDSFVICGGPCATHPEPLAPFVDFFVIGDGEDLFVRLALFVGEKRRENKLTRSEILYEVATNFPGIYVPSLYEVEECEKTNLLVVKAPSDEKIPFKVKRFFVDSLKNYPAPTKSPIPHMTAIFDRFSVELTRGCTEGCRFCQAGMIYRPVRERAPNDVVAAMMDGIKNGGFDEASLTCLSTADYSAVTPLILDLLDKMKEEKATLGISSLRAYGLDKRVFDKLAESKNSSLTFAPEAGTERMRNVINKNISEDDMMKTAADVFSRGWVKMKLYFMIGLPTETDEDVIGIMETGRKARMIGRQCGVREPNITISASSFVPKPHTPFQWCAMISLSEIERKQEMLWKLARDYRLNFRKHLSKTSLIEGIVTRGDRSIAKVIYDAFKLGARFDGWNETFDYGIWTKVLNENQIKVENFLGTIRMDGRIPWDHIDVGLTDRFLEIEWKKALNDRMSPPCGKPAGAIVHHSSLEALKKTHEIEKKKLVCYHCGIKCDLTQMVEERKEFLTSVNAIDDIVYDEATMKVSKTLSERRESVLKTNQGFFYRVGFSKLGPISFISHLDMQKIIARILRRANLPVLMSEGFNPRPILSFGPALSLGISSMIEYFDVRVSEKLVVTSELIKKLNDHSEPGIIFRDFQLIQKNATSIQELAMSFVYYFPLAEGVDISDMKVRVQNWMEREEVIFKNFVPKNNRYEEKNIRPAVISMYVEEDKLNLNDHFINLIDEVSPVKNLQGLYVITNARPGMGVRALDLKEELLSEGWPVLNPIKLTVNLKDSKEVKDAVESACV